MYSNETLPLPLLLGLSIPLEGSKDFVQYGPGVKSREHPVAHT